ncbi:MAG: HAMP domain-containing histidine kinase [Lachnospiraceae bacterium]|nr:HAMP domain-containing histidine kinase [Lachnospiraceae bacterium]
MKQGKKNSDYYSVQQKLRLIVAVFLGFILLATIGMSISGQRANSEDTKAEQIVALNEIEQLAKAGELELLSEKTAALQETLRSTRATAKADNGLWLMCGICVGFILISFGYIYVAILRPFEKMKHFAHKIAQGNLELSLDYERSNYFGAFTWAFDSMRREITKARSCEREAIENNKTVIATLSHDIKTPIASIRAYAEGLEANMDSTPERRAKYLTVIMKKCDEVSKLTNDLFLHSLSDLDKLKINVEKIELCSFMNDVLSELNIEQNDVHFQKPAFEALVSADKNRLTQIAENLINNARKYAKTDISVTIERADNNVQLHFRDYGMGIPDKDMPFIFDKFYRGKNCGNEQGSGLGLYIVKYIATQMSGTIQLHNHADGLEAIVSFPIISKDS